MPETAVARLSGKGKRGAYLCHGFCELGGTPLILRGDELQLSRGESPRDTARVLSRYVAMIGIRTLVTRSRAAISASSGSP